MMRSLQWCKENIFNNEDKYPPEIFRGIEKFCGKILMISDAVDKSKYVDEGYYNMAEDTECEYYWTDEMIEGLVEEEALKQYEVPTGSIKIWDLPGGYIFKDDNGNVINATKIVLEKKSDDKLKLESTKKVREYWSEYTRIFIEIYDDEPNECILTHLYTLEGHRQKGYGRQALIEAESIAKELGCHTAYLKVETNSWMHEWYLRMGYKWYKTVDKEYIWLVKNLTGMEKKKKEYPKTYKECLVITPYDKEERILYLLEKFKQLLICRNAYWKITGEGMGLGKPWEPDWNDGELKWCMSYSGNYIEFDQYKSKHHILAFPTEEMRDAFYENFKELIESCKELL